MHTVHAEVLHDLMLWPHLDILLENLDGSRHQHVPHLCCLLCCQGPTLQLIHWLYAQCAGLVVLQQLLQASCRLLRSCAGMQAPGRAVAVTAGCCCRTLLPPLLIQLVSKVVVLSVHFRQLSIL